MGMGWHNVDITYEDSRRPCKCGKGVIITYNHVYEESEMAPFERFTTTTESTCPDNCEQV